MVLRMQASGEEDFGVEPSFFKWFFNYVGFEPGQLDRQVGGAGVGPRTAPER
jgi:hypothetical protein